MRTPEQEDSYELHVARDHVEEHHGKFVTLCLEAMLQADGQNFELMRPVVRALIKKYEMGCVEQCVQDGTGWTGPIPEWVSA